MINPFKRRQNPKKFTFGQLVQIVWTSITLLTPREKVQFGVTVAARFMMNGLDLLAVGLTGLLGAMTATGLSGGGSYYVLGFQIPAPTPETVILIVGAVAGMVVIKGGLAILLSRYTAIVLAGIEIKAAVKIARHLFSGTLGRLRGYSRAEISWAINNSTNAAFSGVLGAVTSILIDVSLGIGIVVLFFIVDPVAALGVILYFSVVVYLMQLFTARKYLDSGQRIREASVDTQTVILEMVDAFREIAVLNRQDYFLTVFGEAKKLTTRINLTLQILKKIPRYLAETGLILGVLLFVIWQLNSGSLAEALIAVGVFMAGSFRLMGVVLPLQSVWNELRVSQFWVRQAHEILQEIGNSEELIDSRIFSESRTVNSGYNSRDDYPIGVALNNVSFTYPNSDIPAIRAVSLEIVPGQFAALVGPSGAGKSTIVDLMLGLHEPSEGSISMAGSSPQSVIDNSPGLISYVPQRPGLISGTIAGNVALGISEDEIDEELVRACLRKAQLLDFVETLPEGIYAGIGSQADSLSGGQAQRLGLARALYSRPKFIVLDEATSALDASTEASVAASVQDLGSDTTVLVVAHRLSTIQHADVVFVIDSGRLVASGTFSEVRRAVPLVEEYVRLMSFEDE